MDNGTVEHNVSSGDSAVVRELSVFAMVTVTLQALLMVLIVLGNSLVLAAICRFQVLQDVTGVFVANLAVSDLIIGVTQPFQTVFFFLPDLEMNKTACIMRYLVITFACNASIYSLVCTVIDRYIAIKYPFTYHELMTKTTAYCMVVAIWTVDFMFQCIPLFGVNNYDQAPFCLYELVMNKWYRLFNFTSGLFFAFCMFLIYVHVYLIVRKHVTQIESEVTAEARALLKRTKQMNSAVAVVVLFFHISWLPFFFIQMTMLDAADVTRDKVMVANFLVFLGIINSVVNPIVYAWKNKRYRRAFKKLLCIKANPDETTISTVA
ncbi:D(2) dopamine receptor-like [Mya arenaria]|uniref:D(2) dopamine receptor-like n=1 Tax=Mya arenaria TaxID=6604 RepID=UPI0022E19E6F|nr:D(2) dopamine receptor-like [Mya arenaria]